MAKQSVTITNETGLHARPASEFTKLATSFPCDVFLEKEGKKINAKSILGVLSLAICKGNQVDVITQGQDEDESLVKLVEFITNLKD